MSNNLRIKILGTGAWGPGFCDWQTLEQHLETHTAFDTDEFVSPKPTVIPANERRRAPLPVKLAVETSWQACQQAELDPADFACVFASGLGDTETTDYMCKALTTEEKLLSPTRFHNSVHNAAAGYWTISTGCMHAANSIAGFEETVPLGLLETAVQACGDNTPMLLTLFDAKTADIYKEMFSTTQSFGASLAVAPEGHAFFNRAGPIISLTVDPRPGAWPAIGNEHLRYLYEANPSARILAVLDFLLNKNTQQELNLPLSQHSTLRIIKQ